jgi:hypothetical protein
VAEAQKLLEKIQGWKQKRDDPAYRNATIDDSIHHAVAIRQAAMLDLFGHPWQEFSSADDQEGDILDELEAMLQKFIQETA